MDVEVDAFPAVQQAGAGLLPVGNNAAAQVAVQAACGVTLAVQTVEQNCLW